MVDVGISPMDAITFSTSNAADLMRLEKTGRIQDGNLADLLIVEGNPLEDLSAIGTEDKWFDGPERPDGVQTIRVIMKNGVIYKNTL